MSNFAFLRPRWDDLALLAGLAEQYARTDADSALVKLRLFGEQLVKFLFYHLRLPRRPQPTFLDLLQEEAFKAVTPRPVLDKLHALRRHGNQAAHGGRCAPRLALSLLQEAHDL